MKVLSNIAKRSRICLGWKTANSSLVTVYPFQSRNEEMDGLIQMLPAYLRCFSTHMDYHGQRLAERVFQVRPSKKRLFINRKIYLSF